jgi:uncharacterized sporulation protein YeaH/YhbH (DUF444 family)
MKMNSKVVIFCIMDVSGSMDQQKKETARNLFNKLILGTAQAYPDDFKVVFIKHHTAAMISPTAGDFFNSNETGGTIVSSALKLMCEQIENNYLEDWDIYVAQASDGDNWHEDCENCVNILDWEIMPNVKQYAYFEITPTFDPHHLWECYNLIKSGWGNQFIMKHVVPGSVQ